MNTPRRRAFAENLPIHFQPFVNRRMRKVLSSFHSQHDKEDDHHVTKILFLGCHDLRDALQAAIDAEHANITNLHIHLNDVNSLVMSRIVFLLKIISASDFNPNCGEDVAFLWDVWYNVEWPETTRARFQRVLNDLLDGKLPENLVVSSSSQLQCLTRNWNSWSSIASHTQPESELLKKIHQERCNLMSVGLERLSSTVVEQSQLYPLGSHFFLKVNAMAKELEENIGQENLPNSVKQKIREEGQMYYETGSCNIKTEKRGFLNPTMLHPKTRKWETDFTLCPFYGYIPLLQDEKLDTTVGNGILVKYCQKTLQALLSSYRRRMMKVKLIIHSEDPLEFCYKQTTKFDVIEDCSLTDLVGLANVINACSRIMSENPEARGFTCTAEWTNLAPSIEKYVENALFCPLSMIPTYYGLRLADHVELGASALVNLRLPRHPYILCWKKAPLYRNTSPSFCPKMATFLEDLSHACFDHKKLRKFTGLLPGDGCGMMCYSPLTFYYVLSAMVERVGGQAWMKDARSVRLPSFFDITRRAIEAWMDGQAVLKLSLRRSLDSLIKTPMYEMICRMGSSPVLRLTLSKNLLSEIFKVQHYLDKFELEMEKNAEGEITSIFVSFLMPLDHVLEGSYSVLIDDFANGISIFDLGPLSSFQVEEISGSFPYQLSSSEKLPPAASSKQMVAKECVEDESKYVLKIQLDGDDANVSESNLNVTASQLKPCESAHDVTITLSQSGDIKPLTLSFPHPFLIEEIEFSFNRKDFSIDLELKKALLEPWPCEFQMEDSIKWVPDNLKPWKDVEGLRSLENHIRSQINVFKHPSVKETSPLVAIRMALVKIFSSLTSHKSDFVIYVRLRKPNKTQECQDVMLFQVHQPLLTSPLYSPMIIVTAFDLQQNGTREKQQTLPIAMQNKAHYVYVDTPEEVQMFRYVVRVNSTKMLPTTRQKKNLIHLGENACLATFLSPLYLDSPFYDYIKSTCASAKGNVLQDERSCCASCNSKPPKLLRCGRCRSVFYCSLKCQHAHWKTHKSVCHRKE